jgi:transposase InsO family protein
MMCRSLKVSKAGYYAWRERPSSERSRSDERLLTKVKMIHRTSRETYGSPRVHAQLRREGTRVGKKRVARLMKAAGVLVRIRRRFRVTTTSQHEHPIAPNVLKRRFGIAQVGAVDRCWASDITYIDTLQGWLYLAVILDLRSRRVIGWSMSQSLEERIVLDALRMALAGRQPARGVIFHSDRGSQYAGAACRRLLRDHGLRSSMSRKGDCWDNAVIESFNATIKTELIYRMKWLTREQARAAIYEYIETWYNARRLHSTLGYVSPIEFEEQELRNRKSKAA